MEGRCFHQDASSLPRALPHPASPRSLPSVPPSCSSLPPAQPPSRPPQQPPAGTCVALVQFPLSLGCLSAGLRWLAPPPREPPPPLPPAWPPPPESIPPPGVVFSGAPPIHLVFASRPPTCLWRRDVWESPCASPAPTGLPPRRGESRARGRGGRRAGRREGREEGRGRPRGPTRRRAQLPLLLSPAPKSRRHLPGQASEGRRRAGGAGDPCLGPRSGEESTATDLAGRPSPLRLRYVDGAGSSSLRGPRKVCLKEGSGAPGPQSEGVGGPREGGESAAC